MFSNTSVFAQCTPDPGLSTPGFSPDTLPNGCVNLFYGETIQLVSPLDTTISIPIPPFILTIPFDSFKVVSVNNLPSGLSSDCGNTTCTYIAPGGGEMARGCVDIFGIPVNPVLYNQIAIDIEGYMTVPIIGSTSAVYTVYPVITIRDGGMQVVLNNSDGDDQSLRDFVVNACPNDTLGFDPVLYGDTIRLSGNEIDISTGLNIIGPSLPNQIHISGETNSRVFNILPGSSLFLQNLNLINGSPSDGLILNAGALTARNVNVFDQ